MARTKPAALKTRELRVRLSQIECERIETTAARRGTTMSEFVRAVLRATVRRSERGGQSAAR